MRHGPAWLLCSLLLLPLLPTWPHSSAAETTDRAGERWHFRTLAPPKILYLADNANRETWADELRRLLPATVTVVPLAYSDLDKHHLCDKPLEESREDVAYVDAQGRAWLEEQTADLSRFDLVIAQFPPARETALQERLAAWVRDAGGRLLFINPSWETSFADTPLAAVLPVQAGKHKAWTAGTAGATDHPLTRGLPLEIVGAHWYGPVYEPAAADCEPLSRAVGTGPGGAAGSARFWHRRLPGGGQTVHLFTFGGSRWPWVHATGYAAYAADRPDDSAVWRDLACRLAYGLVYGDRAFPVLAAIDLADAGAVRHGEVVALNVALENRSPAARQVDVEVTLDTRRPDQPLVQTRRANLERGARVAEPFQFPAVVPCSDNWLRFRVRVLDPLEGTLLATSVAWRPYRHRVPLTVDAGAPACRPGDLVRVRVEWPEDAEPGVAEAALYVVDADGRILCQSAAPLRLVRGAAGTWMPAFIMPDGGPLFAGSRWLVAVMRRDGVVAGSAWQQLQVDAPWSMRNLCEWSVWSQGGSPRYMTLLRDAGFNALGMQGNAAQADRHGLRQYVEGTGINTFGVTIDHDNWDAVRADMQATLARLDGQGPDARSKSLVSLGEESGFKGGWGMRYYWEEEHAPPHVQTVFGEYLAERYANDLAALNREWGTAHTSFATIPLEKAKVRTPGQVFVAAQAWEAMQAKGEGAGRLPVDVRAADADGGPYLAHTAPYLDTYGFFDWYYQRYCDLATACYRESRNPVPRTIMSAPGGFYPKVDVYNFAGLGPFYPKETGLAGNAAARLAYGDEPGFSGAMWAYFDLRSLWSATLYSAVLAGNTHIDYWVDIPLTFNADLTHTRASLWTKILRAQLAPVEPILLHQRPHTTPGLGLLLGGQPLERGVLGRHFHSGITPNTPLYAALAESGLHPRVVDAMDLAGIRVLVASHAQVLAPAAAQRVRAFVEAGGTLISTPWLGMCSAHGNPLAVYPAPGSGLDALLGFTLLNRSQEPEKREAVVELPNLGLPAPLQLLSRGRDEVREPAPDVEVLARYADGVPLLLRREVGRGTVLYLNLLYDWSHWWNSFHEPSREAYRRLLEALVQAGAPLRREGRIRFVAAEPVRDNHGWWLPEARTLPKPGDPVPWWATQLHRDPSGKVRYLAVLADHRSPRIQARIDIEPGQRVFDLLGGAELRPTADGQPGLPLDLRPGEAAFWALTPWAPERIRLACPRSLTAGDTLRAQVTLPGAAAAGVVCGVTLDVFRPDGQRSPLHSPRAVQVRNGAAEVAIAFAFNDPPGAYRLVVTESLTRLQAEARVDVAPAAGLAAPAPAALSPFPPRAEEEQVEAPVGSAALVELLRALRTLYAGSYEGLENKYRLSFFLHVPFRPDGRHGLVRRLQRCAWEPHLSAVADALRGGETFLLLGEDLSRDPLSGTRIDPLAQAEPDAFLAALARLPGARQEQLEMDGFRFRRIRLGTGSLIVAPDASIDRAAYHSADMAAWHARLKQALAALPP